MRHKMTTNSIKIEHSQWHHSWLSPALYDRRIFPLFVLLFNEKWLNLQCVTQHWGKEERQYSVAAQFQQHNLALCYWFLVPVQEVNAPAASIGVTQRVGEEPFSFPTTKTKIMRYTEIKNLENEEWRPVKGYEGRFEVSNYGRVKSFLTMGNCRKVGAEYAHLLKPKKTNRGYLRVCLRIDGKTKDFSVHRLVVDAFIGIPDGMVVNHIDGCKTNNNLTNLEVVTYTGNLLHAIHTGLNRVPKNKTKPIAVLRNGDVVATFPSIKQACYAYGLKDSSVSHVLSGRKKTLFGYTFKYI